MMPYLTPSSQVSTKPMAAPRYKVSFDRIMMPKFKVNKYTDYAIFGPTEEYKISSTIQDLVTYDRDIKKIFTEFMLKDILEEEDKKFEFVVDTLINEGLDWYDTGVVYAEFGK